MRLVPDDVAAVGEELRERRTRGQWESGGDVGAGRLTPVAHFYRLFLSLVDLEGEEEEVNGGNKIVRSDNGAERIAMG